MDLAVEITHEALNGGAALGFSPNLRSQRALAMLLLLAQQSIVSLAANQPEAIPADFLTSPTAIVHMLLFTLVASEVLRTGSVVLAYRRGA